MKTSEMIKKLQESLEENGDVEIKFFDREWGEFHDFDIEYGKEEGFLFIDIIDN